MLFFSVGLDHHISVLLALLCLV